MQKKISYSAATLLLSLLLSTVSCTPESCFEETNAFLKATFYASTTGKAAPPDSLSMYGLKMSSVKLYNKAARVQPAYVPLNASSDQCTYIIKINGIQDTLTIWYSSFPHLISIECGYTFYHNIDSVRMSKRNIDDIIIRNSNVTTLKEENLRIFY
jgi:hypothetical protein